MRRLRKCTILLVIFLVGAAIYAWFATRQLASLTPSSGNVSFENFANEMPSPRFLTHVQLRDGTRRVVWGGEVATMIVPSGGSCYIFSQTGSLVEWSPTTGDGESVDKIWRQAISEQSITIDDAKELLEAE